MQLFFLFIVVQISAKLLDVPILSKPTSAIMKKMYVRLGFDLAKTVKDEIDNCLRVCTEIDFKFHTKNLTLMGDRKLPVLLAYSLNDNMMQHAIFNEISPLMGLKTLPEMAAIEDTHGNKYYYNLLSCHKIVR